jgi:phosphoglycerate-specific signal transduction histidine kinase
MSKATRTTMKVWIENLNEAIKAKEESIDNTENEEVQAKLEEEIDSLQEIQDAISNYLDL